MQFDPTSDHPLVPIRQIEQLWFQVAGTRCNLACQHCFISCHPKNKNFGFLSLADVKARLEESVALGTREYYFTGGEPFLNKEMTDILVETLRFGPATVLTNGTVLRDDWLQRLAAAERESLYSLEFRVSLDGFTAAANDPLRGQGTFDKALAGIAMLVHHGFLPIITAVRTWSMTDEPSVLSGFTDLLKSHGYNRPRIKILPTLEIGAQAERSGGYSVVDRVTASMMEGFDPAVMVCNYSRIVTDRGVHVCPILIESPDSLMGDRLQDSIRPFPIVHGACSTCYRFGAICSNASTRKSASQPAGDFADPTPGNAAEKVT